MLGAGTLALAAGESFATSPRTAAALQFHARLENPKPAYTRTDPLQVRFVLKNVGRKPVWVNKRFYAASEEIPKNGRDVVLDVTAPSGAKLTCKYAYETGLPKTDDFVQLDPGQEAVSERALDLRGYFDFAEAGAYSIVAVYENVFGDEIGLDAFREALRSPPVSITIAE